MLRVLGFLLLATTQAQPAQPVVVDLPGCRDPTHPNYNAATEEDGSCCGIFLDRDEAMYTKYTVIVGDKTEELLARESQLKTRVSVRQDDEDDVKFLEESTTNEINLLNTLMTAYNALYNPQARRRTDEATLEVPSMTMSLAGDLERITDLTAAKGMWDDQKAANDMLFGDAKHKEAEYNEARGIKKSKAELVAQTNDEISELEDEITSLQEEIYEVGKASMKLTVARDDAVLATADASGAFGVANTNVEAAQKAAQDAESEASDVVDVANTALNTAQQVASEAAMAKKDTDTEISQLEQEVKGLNKDITISSNAGEVVQQEYNTAVVDTEAKKRVVAAAADAYAVANSDLTTKETTMLDAGNNHFDAEIAENMGTDCTVNLVAYSPCDQEAIDHAQTLWDDAILAFATASDAIDETANQITLTNAVLQSALIVEDIARSALEGQNLMVKELEQLRTTKEQAIDDKNSMIETLTAKMELVATAQTSKNEAEEALANVEAEDSTFAVEISDAKQIQTEAAAEHASKVKEQTSAEELLTAQQNTLATKTTILTEKTSEIDQMEHHLASKQSEAGVAATTEAEVLAAWDASKAALPTAADSAALGALIDGFPSELAAAQTRYAASTAIDTQRATAVNLWNAWNSAKSSLEANLIEEGKAKVSRDAASLEKARLTEVLQNIENKSRDPEEHGSCIECASGTWASNGADDCQLPSICTSGKYIEKDASTFDDTVCTTCLAGTFSGVGAGKCEPCSTVNNLLKSPEQSASCTECKDGFTATQTGGHATCAWDGTCEGRVTPTQVDPCADGEYFFVQGDVYSATSCHPLTELFLDYQGSDCCDSDACPCNYLGTQLGTSCGTAQTPPDTSPDTVDTLDIEFNREDYTVCEGNPANVVWNGLHDICEVSQAKYDSEDITDCTERYGQVDGRVTPITKTLNNLGAGSETRYFLCTLHPTGFTTSCGASLQSDQCTDPFISEVAGENGYNRYLEFFNPTNEVIDLDNYALAHVAGHPNTVGVHEYWNKFTDGATIDPGGVYVVCHSKASTVIKSECDQQHNYLSNGDDGLCLAEGTEDNYTCIDYVGDFQEDPGSGWKVAGVSDATKDHTLVRKSGKCGETNWTVSAGTDSEDSQWWVKEQDDFSDIGEHSA